MRTIGYTTEFYGSVEVQPPLNPSEIDYLKEFAESRRMARSNGPYFVDGTGDFGQGRDADVIDFNTPPPGQPGLWCQWIPSKDGTEITWDGGEKFYSATEWMQYLIDHFLKPGAVVQGLLTYLKPESQIAKYFTEFTFDHVVNGVIEAQGEESGDLWKLKVTDNVVTVVAGRVVFDDERS